MYILFADLDVFSEATWCLVADRSMYGKRHPLPLLQFQFTVSNLILVFVRIMTLTSFNSAEYLLAKLESAMLWVWCEERCVNEQYWREWGRSQLCDCTDTLKSWSKRAVWFINTICCFLSL
jgi:hypothetical protein